jgi:RHS repeat-associated protein
MLRCLEVQVAGKAVAIVKRSTQAGNDDTLYLHEDHLGSTDVITNSAGAVVVRQSFDAWGHRRGSNWTGVPSAADKSAISATTHQGFTGHEHLDNLNLVHMKGRVYDPVIARFMSADPVIQDPYHSQAFNRYTYVWNNPLNATDPKGFCKVTGSHIEADKCVDWATGKELDAKNDVRDNGQNQGTTARTPVVEATNQSAQITDQNAANPLDAPQSEPHGRATLNGWGPTDEPDRWNARMAGKVEVTKGETETLIEIKVTASYDRSISRQTAERYVESIGRDWNTEFPAGDGRMYVVKTTITLMEAVPLSGRGGDVHLTRCSATDCNWLHPGRANPSRGVMEIDEPEQHPNTPAHEFGHILGLGHRMYVNDSIMRGYTPDRALSVGDLMRVSKLYD